MYILEFKFTMMCVENMNQNCIDCYELCENYRVIFLLGPLEIEFIVDVIYNSIHKLEFKLITASYIFDL